MADVTVKQLMCLDASVQFNNIIHALENDISYSGTSEDIPEGSKYATFSYSMVQELVKRLRNIRNQYDENLGGD